jgi:hypothetical protein
MALKGLPYEVLKGMPHKFLKGLPYMSFKGLIRALRACLIRLPKSQNH